MLSACLLIFSLPVLAEESEIYGLKLLDLDRESIQNSSIAWPAPGTKPSEEWLEWDGMRMLASYQLDPVWLPDGQTIACSTTGPHSSIFLIPVDGGEPIRLYTAYFIYEGYYIGSPHIELIDVTPDGKEIFFSSSIIDEKRGTQVTLTFNSDGSYNGCSMSNPVPVIQAINIQTGEVRTLVENAWNGKYSHNGRFFAYFHQTYDGIRNDFLQVQDTQTGSEWTLGGMWDFCFSANDAYIIFNEDDNNNSQVGQLFSIPVTGGAPEQITFDNGDELTTEHLHPECSPDGRWILFSGNGGPRSNTISDSTGSHSYIASAIPKLCAYNIYSRETLEFFPREPAVSSVSAKFSPDGTKFCYMYSNYDQLNQSIEVYIMDFDCSSGNESFQTVVATTRPSDFALLGNYPNPFNPSTTIEFSLPEAGFAQLVIYNVMGQKVRELVAGTMTPGVHSVVWDGRDYSGKTVSAGVYFSQLRMNDQVVTGRMTLVK